MEENFELNKLKFIKAWNDKIKLRAEEIFRALLKEGLVEFHDTIDDFRIDEFNFLYFDDNSVVFKVINKGRYGGYDEDWTESFPLYYLGCDINKIIEDLKIEKKLKEKQEKERAEQLKLEKEREKN